MTEIESRLTEALQASVADAMPGFDVVAAVHRRRRLHLIRAAVASAAAIAALGTTAAILGAPGGSAPGVRPAVASAVAGVPCKATTATPGGPLPAAFRPVAVARCYPQARGIPGRGLWRFEVKQQADHRLAPFIAALRRPSIPTPPHVVCLNIRYVDPPLALVDRHGRIVRPALPVKECGQPFPAAVTSLRHLPWKTVSVRRTVPLATRAELWPCDSAHRSPSRLATRARADSRPRSAGRGKNRAMSTARQF